jgi:hypothetical protein
MDSAIIAGYFKDKRILITGPTGFLGKSKYPLKTTNLYIIFQDMLNYTNFILFVEGNISSVNVI